MKDFRQLRAWEKAHQLTLAVYGLTSGFPNDEKFGLTSQVRRCSASIAANIAEGCGRTNDGDFCRFLDVAMGSTTELDYHLLLARDLGLIDKRKYDEFHTRIFEVKRMLSTLIRKIQDDRRAQ